MKSSILFVLLFVSSVILCQSNIDVKLLENEFAAKDYLVIFHHQPAVNTESVHGKNQKAKIVIESLKKVAHKSQSNLCQWLDKKNIYYEKFYLVNALRVQSSTQIMREIANRPEVKFVYKNIHIAVEKTQQERIFNTRNPEPEWGIKKIGADSVWQMGYTGQGIIVGGQDTGYDWKVNPLKRKYRGYVNDSMSIHDYNWHDAIHGASPLSGDTLNPCGFNIKEPCDDNNHGTHTMGTMVGSDSINSIGVAPNAQWMACRNMERGNGQLSTYLECFEWFIAPTDINGLNPDLTKAPHVINNSWYCSENEGCHLSNWEPLQIAVLNLKAAGIVVVVSAGNSGPDCHTIASPPALFEPSFVVGATAINDTITSFSSRGPVAVDSSFRLKPDVSAPGRDVRSVIKGGFFANFSGTSMAGPHVVGLVALILSANPTLIGEVDIIEDIIRSTADPKYSDQECDAISGQSYPNPIYGHGRVNAIKAIDLALKTIVDNSESIPQIDWDIYPNPTSDYLTIRQKSPAPTMQLFRMITAAGQEVLKKSFQTNLTVDLQSFPNQVYFYTITSQNKTFSGKILKQ